MGKPTYYKEILKNLDIIFDYLTIEELTLMIGVSKFFWYVATMDKLYLKFGIVASETYDEESLWSYHISEIYSNPKFKNRSESNSASRHMKSYSNFVFMLWNFNLLLK